MKRIVCSYRDKNDSDAFQALYDRKLGRIGESGISNESIGLMTGLGARLGDVFTDVAGGSDDEDSALGGHWMKISCEVEWGKRQKRSERREDRNWKLVNKSCL